MFMTRVEMCWKRLRALSMNVCACAVRAEVDYYVGIDYSLLSDPVVSGTSLDMDFRVSVLLPVMLTDWLLRIFLCRLEFSE